MSVPSTTGLLLINLGTPASPEPRDVRRYLREFLMDPRVLDVPAPVRWAVVHLAILPRRPRASGEAYEKIWTEEGSPLLVHSRRLAGKVQQRLGDAVAVDLAMRYGEPSIAGALARFQEKAIDRIVIFPLYPQYSSAATGSSIDKVFDEARRYWNTPFVQVVPPFYDHPAFLDACAEVIRPVVEQTDPERVFFSFHGLPERQVRKSDLTGRHCLAAEGCCNTIVHANRNCYRAQCFATARLLAERLAVSRERSIVCFQSRLGRDPWIRPYTDELLVREARRGVRRAVIASPAFVADCLETLEELGMRGVETWQESGGETLTLAPCINSTDRWADAVVTIARESTTWLGGKSVAADRDLSAVEALSRAR